MRKDTLAVCLLLIFVIPFSLSIGVGYFIDYERGCTSNKDCPSDSSCQQGNCVSKARCGPGRGKDIRKWARERYMIAKQKRREAHDDWKMDSQDEDTKAAYKRAKLAEIAARRAFVHANYSRSRRVGLCPSGATCDSATGSCRYSAQIYSSWIYLHPGYYPHRSRMLRYRRFRKALGRTGRRYRGTGFRRFRGGGLGFGK